MTTVHDDLVALERLIGTTDKRGLGDMRTIIKRAQSDAGCLISALQWLLDDMSDADETHSPTGIIFASVECAAAALVNAGGSLPWYTPEQAKAYAESHP